MMLPFPHFESAVTQRRTMARAKTLFESGVSTGTDVISGTLFHVHYPANDNEESDYKVVIQIQDGWVSYFSCPCPSTQGPMCEHSIAALYQIRHDNVWKSGEDTEEGLRISQGNRKQFQVKSKSPEEEPEEEDEDLESEDEDESEEATGTQKELECQICLNVVKKPVLMACKAHSVCFACLESLFNHKKKGRDGKREINCPTCGTKSGSLKIKNIKDVKVNKNLLQLKQSYKDDKRKWEDERLQLQIQIAEMKALKEKQQQELSQSKSSEEKKLDESQEVQVSQNSEETKANNEAEKALESIDIEETEKKIVSNGVNKDRMAEVDGKQLEQNTGENNSLRNDDKIDLEDSFGNNQNKENGQQENGRARKNLKRKEFFEDDAAQETDPTDKTIQKVLKRVKK